MCKYILGELTAQPQYLPMLPSDAKLSSVALFAAGHDGEVPLSELVRKQFFYKCFSEFEKAISANPAFVAEEIRAHCTRFDYFFGTRFN